ncbi:MAG: hypothetical protein ABIR94_13305 [Rubrivivax sp.]
MLKTVDNSGQLTLGKRYAGRHFELQELPGGELLLCPVCLVHDTAEPRRPRSARLAAFQIAEVEQVVMLTREQRNARR